MHIGRSNLVRGIDASTGTNVYVVYVGGWDKLRLRVKENRSFNRQACNSLKRYNEHIGAQHVASFHGCGLMQK